MAEESVVQESTHTCIVHRKGLQSSLHAVISREGSESNREGRVEWDKMRLKK